MNAPNPIDDSHGFCLHVFESFLGHMQIGNLPKTLGNLRPYMEDLRSAYKTNSVSLEYEEALCHAYLLAYVPVYLHQSKFLFEKCFESRVLPDSVTVAFLACGPGTEAVAFTDYLLRESPETKAELNFFDLQESHWSEVREGMVRIGCEERSPNISCESHYLDLIEDGAFRRYEEIFTKADLVVMQNCVNEIIDAREIAKENFKQLFQMLKQEAIFCSSDLKGYKPVRDFLSELRDCFEEFGEVEGPFDKNYRKLGPPEDSLLLEHFYRGGFGLRLTPRSTVKAQENIFVRKYDRAVSDSDDESSESGPSLGIIDRLVDKTSDEDNLLYAIRVIRQEVIRGNEYARVKLEENGYLKLETEEDLNSHIREDRSFCIALAIATKGALGVERSNGKAISREIQRAFTEAFDADEFKSKFTMNSNSITVELVWPSALFVNVARIRIRNLSTSSNEEVTEFIEVQRDQPNVYTYNCSHLLGTEQETIVNVSFGLLSPATDVRYFDGRSQSCSMSHNQIEKEIDTRGSVVRGEDVNPEDTKEEPDGEESSESGEFEDEHIEEEVDSEPGTDIKQVLLGIAFVILCLGFVFILGYFIEDYFWG